MANARHRATEGDLNAYGHAALEVAYRRRVRPKASRDDYADGYIQALVDHDIWAAFTTPPELLIGALAEQTEPRS